MGKNDGKNLVKTLEKLMVVALNVNGLKSLMINQFLHKSNCEAEKNPKIAKKIQKKIGIVSRTTGWGVDL